MELLNEYEIKCIVKQCYFSKLSDLRWSVENYSDKMIGYLGEHLSLVISGHSNENFFELKMFIKCVPRFDKWKANYLRETLFFNKEYVMLNKLFKHFEQHKGLRKWRPKLLYIKEELFVFEDVTQMGYVMPSNLDTFDYNQVMAAVSALARFHAQSYIYEEKKSKKLLRPYRIWEDYSEYLHEPPKGQSWRDTGMRAAIDLLREFSQFKEQNNFDKLVENIIVELYEKADKLMKPSSRYRNVVVHRDLWTNNIFFKKLENGATHALIIDFQTVLYAAPMLDLSSFIYFNTTRNFRDNYKKEVIEYYNNKLEEELSLEGINFDSIIDRNTIMESYSECEVFGMTQAALIVPITNMTDEKRKETFADPQTCVKVNVISRSQEFIDLAKENEQYRKRVIELLDDIIEKSLISKLKNKTE